MAETPISSPGFFGHDVLNSSSHPKPRALSDEERLAAERAVEKYFYDVMTGPEGELPPHPVDASRSRFQPPVAVVQEGVARQKGLGQQADRAPDMMDFVGGMGAVAARAPEVVTPGARVPPVDTRDPAHSDACGTAQVSRAHGGFDVGANDDQSSVTSMDLAAQFEAAVTVAAPRTVQVWPNKDGDPSRALVARDVGKWHACNIKLQKVVGDLTRAKGKPWYEATVAEARVNHTKLFFAFDVRGAHLRGFTGLLEEAGWLWSVEADGTYLPRCIAVKWTGPIGLVVEALMEAQKAAGARPMACARLDGNLPREDSGKQGSERLALLSFPSEWCEDKDVIVLTIDGRERNFDVLVTPNDQERGTVVVYEPSFTSQVEEVIVPKMLSLARSDEKLRVRKCPVNRAAGLSKPHFEISYPHTPGLERVIALLTSEGRMPYKFDKNGKPLAHAYFGDTPEAVGLRQSADVKAARQAILAVGADAHVTDLL